MTAGYREHQVGRHTVVRNDDLVDAVDLILAMPVIPGGEEVRAEAAKKVARCALYPQSVESLSALVPSIEWALFGTTDGELVGDDADLPVAELRRLLREWARSAGQVGES